MHYFLSATLAKSNEDNQGKTSTNGMSVRWIPHINELFGKYGESHEWFGFGGSLWRILFWRYNQIHFIKARSSKSLKSTYTGPEFLVNHISNTLTDEGNFRVSGLESFYNIVMENALTKEQTDDINNNDTFINMLNEISNYSKETSKKFRTSKLWLLYIEYIYIAFTF